MNVEALSLEDEDRVVDVLSDAFAGYPVMRFVLGAATHAGDERLRTLVGFFIRARTWQDHPVLGIRDGGDLVAVATLTPPFQAPPPETLAELRAEVWAQLGNEARSRYEAFGRATAPFDPGIPHYHVNMLGVRPSRQGRGFARALLDAVHALSREGSDSGGVTLTTEAPGNLELYRHFGYRSLGHAVVGDGLETWGLFRPDP